MVGHPELIPDSTQQLSQNAGQVSFGSVATKNCLKAGVHYIDFRTARVNPIVRQFNGYTVSTSERAPVQQRLSQNGVHSIVETIYSRNLMPWNI